MIRNFLKRLKLRLLPSVKAREKIEIPKANVMLNDSYLDRVEFRYILWLDRIYQKISHVPGHIVELGVARGRNAIIFSHLITMNGDDEVRKYYGFDTFNGFTNEDIIQDPHLQCNRWKDISKAFVENRLNNLGFRRITSFVEGDIAKTTPEFIDQNPNFRAALLYVDCNAYRAAIAGMNAFKNNMSPGGIICIDEKQQGGETRALIDFCKSQGVKYQKDMSPFSVPAYTIIP